MKILLLNKQCGIGGVETLMVRLASGLQARGHECELFFLHRGAMERHLPANFAAHFGGITDCLKLIRARNFDVVHANSNDWELGVALTRLPGVKLIVTAHGFVMPGWTSRNCDAFVGCARWLAEAQQPFTDLPTQVVLNGVDTNLFTPVAPLETGALSLDESPDKPIVAWVGRGADLAQKRLDKFAAIAPALHAAGVRVWLAEPNGAAEVEQVAPDAARVLQRVAEVWRGVPQSEMPGFYREIAASGGCVVSTSAFEGLPISLLEAQASGCPVIGADVRGTNECVNPEHGGILYPFEIEADALAHIVLDAIGNKAEMRRRSQACAQYVHEKFGVERMIDEYARIYCEAPFPPLRRSAAIEARMRLSPLVNWQNYLAHRWTTGECHFALSQRLAAEGEWNLAAHAARSTLATCPTLYLRPRRAAHLIKTNLRASFARVEKTEAGEAVKAAEAKERINECNG